MRARRSRLGRLVALLSLALGLPVLITAGRGPVVPAWGQQSSCGNAIVEPGEQCDPPGSLSCPAGAACSAGCACPASPTPAVLDHFQCYEIRPPAPVAGPELTLVDRYATWTAQVSRAYTLCAPASKNGEDPLAPARPAHLTSYGVRSSGPFAPRIADVVTQFGTHTIAVVKPKRLLVPTAKGLAAPPAPLAAPLDHFQCYRVKRAPGTVRFARITGVTVDTQFETGATLDLVKPLRLCVPADKNGETPGAAQHPDQLLCFRVKSTGGIGTTRVFLDNQFEAQEYPLSQRREFCVPARPAGAVTTTSTSSSTTSSTTTTTLTACGDTFVPVCGGTCPSGERCAGIGTLDGRCACFPENVTPCSEAGFPTCGGVCTGGLACQSFALVNGTQVEISGCACVDPGTPCGGACTLGACPTGSTCANVTEQSFCGCLPELP